MAESGSSNKERNLSIPEMAEEKGLMIRPAWKQIISNSEVLTLKRGSKKAQALQASNSKNLRALALHTSGPPFLTYSGLQWSKLSK